MSGSIIVGDVVERQNGERFKVTEVDVYFTRDTKGVYGRRILPGGSMRTNDTVVGYFEIKKVQPMPRPKVRHP